MKLKITAIRDADNLQKERIVMKAQSAVNVGEFVLLQTGSSDGTVTTVVHQTFWFPDKEIGMGDYVVLYTKSGIPSDTIFKAVKSHFFYMGNLQPIWNEKDRSAVLMYAPEWESFRVD